MLISECIKGVYERIMEGYKRMLTQGSLGRRVTLSPRTTFLRINSVVECVCATFANLPRYLANALEKVQRRALAIILPGISYALSFQQQV